MIENGILPGNWQEILYYHQHGTGNSEIHQGIGNGSELFPQREVIYKIMLKMTGRKKYILKTDIYFSGRGQLASYFSRLNY